MKINDVKQKIRSQEKLCKVCKSIYSPIRKASQYQTNLKASREAVDRIKDVDASKPKIIYFGIPGHSNLGDQAQRYCILNWIDKNYHGYEVVQFTDKMIRDNRFGLIDRIKKITRIDDLIIMQSGYCTTDMNMPAEVMHRLVFENFSENKILVFPQTVNYSSDKEKMKSISAYNKHKNTTFLARDNVSYEMAQEYFKSFKIGLYPDVVTSLIGKYDFDSNRDGVLFCIRNDGEKLYNTNEIKILRNKIELVTKTVLTDTTISMNPDMLQRNIENVLFETFQRFSKYKLIITDRYHGTIFGLISGTPVIVLASTDHKLSSGVDWFRDIYPNYIYYAHDLDEAYKISTEVFSKMDYSYKLDDYFDKEYYQKLKKRVEEN